MLLLRYYSHFQEVIFAPTLRTLTEITLLCAERPKPQKTGSAWMHLATLYRSLSLVFWVCAANVGTDMPKLVKVGEVRHPQTSKNTKARAGARASERGQKTCLRLVKQGTSPTRLQSRGVPSPPPSGLRRALQLDREPLPCPSHTSPRPSLSRGRKVACWLRSRLLNGRTGISPGMALALERIGLSNAAFWMRRQA